jgi:hypothetical protein
MTSTVSTTTRETFQTVIETFKAEPTLSCLQRVVKMMYEKAASESFTVFNDMNADIYSSLMCISKLDPEREPVVDEVVMSMNRYLERDDPSPIVLHNLLRVTDKLCEATSTEELQDIVDLVMDSSFWSVPHVFDETDEDNVEALLAMSD